MGARIAGIAWQSLLPGLFTGAVFFLPFSVNAATGLFLATGILWLALTVWTGSLVIRRTALDLPLSGVVALSALSITQAPNGFESAYNWSWLFARYVLVYFLAVHVIQPERHARRFFAALLLAAVLIGFHGIYQYMTGVDTSAERWVDSKHFPWLKTRAFSTLGNPNILAGFLVMCIGIAVAFVLEAKKKTERMAAALTIPVMLVCIAVTFSRGAWVALGLMGMAAAALRGRRAKILCLVALIVAVATISFVQGDAMARLRSIGNPSDSSSYLRFLLYESTWDMIVVKPWLGWGWASFPIVCPDYNDYVREEQSTIYHAHNILLHYAAEIGVPGMLFFVWAWGLMAVRFYRLRLLPAPDAKLISYASLTSLAGLAGFCLTDHLLFNSQMSMLFWVFLGLSGRMDQQTGGSVWLEKKFTGLAGYFSGRRINWL